MMQQYEQAKSACGDALLLFRMGDFYELFFDDAKTAARVLGIALTSRDKGENATPMAGFPYHQLDSYLAKLIAAGLRAAVCEQVEDPKQAKGLVKREVTRIVTPGTLTDEALLDPRESNYLAAVLPGAPTGLAWVELSTGRFFATQVPAARLADELSRIAPVECLLPDDAQLDLPQGLASWTVSRRPPWAFGEAGTRQSLLRHFGTHSLEGFGFELPRDAAAIRAAGAVLDYLAETQKAGLGHVDLLVRYQPGTVLEIDEATRRSLELTRSLREGRREGSLLSVLDRTLTPLGARCLAEWLANPLVDAGAINDRLDAVGELVAQPQRAEALREALRKVYDLERLVARVTTGRASPRDLSFLGRTCQMLPDIGQRLAGAASARLQALDAALDRCGDLFARLSEALVEDCPLVSREGGFIRAGFHAELDRLRDLATGGKQWIASYQATQVERTGIPNLKVGFNKVFGYYLEVTNAHGQKVPEDFIRKQTVKNAERYITPELKEYEEQVLQADERAKQLEYELFTALRDGVAAEARRLQRTAAALAEIDTLAGLADLARHRNYCRPEIVAEPVLAIHDGRHPVLDAVLPSGTFVPNDTEAAPDAAVLLLITGPNMAGKSTYIRQVALISLMAHLGSFVPARAARIGLIDRIFARVGASDELARGQSTFMVEMTETARILNGATAHSLVILDEIGRGTSTYDGLSLAWAVTEHLHDRVGCRTLFATHYHELTELAQSRRGIANLNVAVKEWDDQVVFLHKIVDGAADKSYGIHVARLAGVPRTVLDRAKQVLAQLEEEHARGGGGDHRAGPRQLQLTLFGPSDHPVLDRLRETDVNQLTPLAALALLEAWQRELAADDATVKPR
ncbi:MAG: DNA mismatch repair protein MutS [Pirellulales bacterium]|nr:DNA mismatch repair protein MutS [Pirellulales bacterium]